MIGSRIISLRIFRQKQTLMIVLINLGEEESFLSHFEIVSLGPINRKWTYVQRTLLYVMPSIPFNHDKLKSMCTDSQTLGSLTHELSAQLYVMRGKLAIVSVMVSQITIAWTPWMTGRGHCAKLNATSGCRSRKHARNQRVRLIRMTFWR